MQLHWDGDNDSVDERNLSAGLGAGITPVTVDHAGLKRVRDWTWTLPPPAYPYPVDAALAARGATRLRAALRRVPRRPPLPRRASIAAIALGQVEDIDRIGTDRHRLDSYTPTFALEPVRAVSRLALPLHAVPQDARLRQPAARRHLAARRPTCTTARCRRCASCSTRRRGGPASFYRGYDVFDQQRRGLRVQRRASRTAARFSRYDTTRARQRQRRPRVRHDAARRRQGRHRRVPEDLLTLRGARTMTIATPPPAAGSVASCGWASSPTWRWPCRRIAAPDMMIALSRLPTATPPCGRALPACC